MFQLSVCDSSKRDPANNNDEHGWTEVIAHCMSYNHIDNTFMPEIRVNNDIDTYKSYSLQNMHASQLTREKNIILEKERQSKLIQPREMGKRTRKSKRGSGK